ncbi:hypothetical protein H4K36_00915 [Streptomyces sp. DHE7-1]|nr:hypothetical protein [Streptomyces sp. DHE7-1]
MCALRVWVWVVWSPMVAWWVTWIWMPAVRVWLLVNASAREKASWNAVRRCGSCMVPCSG